MSNAGPLLVGRLAVAVVGWAGTVIVARTLDQTDFGKFTFVFGLLGMMTVVTDMGLGRVAIRGVLPTSTESTMAPAVEPERFAGSYVALRSTLGLVGYVLAVGFTLVAGYPSDVVRATALAGLVVVLATVSHAHEIVLQANLKMPVVATIGLAGRLVQLALLIVVALRGGQLLWFIVPAVVAELVILALKVPAARRLLAIRYRLRPAGWWPMLREALPLSIGLALATLSYRIDVVMLSQLDTFAAVGLYEIAFKFADVLHFVSLSVSAPVLTVMVTAWPDDAELLRTTARQTAAFLALLGGGLLVHFTLFAGPTIELLYGSDFGPSADAARWLVTGEVLSFFSVLGLTVLTAMNRHRIYPLVAVLGLALNIGLNLVAIPRWSFDGAAGVTVATEVLVVICVGILVLRQPEVTTPGLGIPIRAIGASALALGVGLATGLVAPWGVAALLAAVSYALAVWALGLVAATGFDPLAVVRR